MKRVYSSIDVGKFVMAIFVVIIHTVRVDDVVLHRVLELAVPFFFIASGFFLEAKNHTCLEKKESIIWQWTLKLLKLYLIWSFVYFPFTIYDYVQNGYTLLSSIVSYVRQLLFIGSGYYSWQLWYLLASVTAGIILYALNRIGLRFWSILLFALLMYLVGIGLENMHPELYYKLFGTTRNGLFVGLILLVIGMGINKFEKALMIHKTLIGCLSVCLVTIFLFCGTPFVIIGAGAMFCFLLCFPIIINPHLSVLLRTTSTQVYLVHMIFVGVLSMVFSMEDSTKKFLIVIVLAICYSYIYFNLNGRRLKNLPFSY